MIELFIAIALANSPSKFVKLSAGSYQPFYVTKDKTGAPTPVNVASFEMQEHPVTNEEFLDFVRAHPQWQKSKVKRVFADDQYLAKWSSDLNPGTKDDRKRPVTFVSWFAAQDYCESLGGSLPTVDQWEYAATETGKSANKVKQKILAWYAHPTPPLLAKVNSDAPNRFGLYDLYDLVWEWTLDFNSSSQSPESREGSKNDNLFCGSGSIGASDATDYGSFMRYSFRNSLKATYTIGNLGFRCVRDVHREN